MDTEIIKLLQLIGAFIGWVGVTYWLYSIHNSDDSFDIVQDTPYNESE